MKNNEQNGLNDLSNFILKFLKFRFKLCYYSVLFIVSFLIGMFIAYKLGW